MIKIWENHLKLGAEMTTKDYSDPKTVQEIIDKVRDLQDSFDKHSNLDHLEEVIKILGEAIENTSEEEASQKKYLNERNRLVDRYPYVQSWLSEDRNPYIQSWLSEDGYDYQLDIKGQLATRDDSDAKTVQEIRNALKQYNPHKLVDSVNITTSNKSSRKVIANNRTEIEETNDSENLNLTDYPLVILGLSTRAYNSLLRSDIKTIDDLIKNKHNLTNIRGIGSLHATEILTKLSDFLSNEEKDDSIIERSDDLNNILLKNINDFEFSAPTTKKLLRYGLFSIGDVVEYLYDKPSSSPSISKLTSELSQILKIYGFTLMDAFQGLSINSLEITAPPTNTSNTELHKRKFDSEQSFTDILMRWFSIIDEREIRIIEKYYGLKSGKKQTLEDISEKEGCTRERIRQIKNHAMTKLKKNLVSQEYNLFNPLKKQINERNGIISTTRLSQDFKGELNKRNLIAENFFLFLRDFIKKLEKN